LNFALDSTGLSTQPNKVKPQQYNIQIHMENCTRLGGRMLETVDSVVARIWGRTTKFDLSLSHIDLSLS
jgi:hypothetical protein